MSNTVNNFIQKHGSTYRPDFGCADFITQSDKSIWSHLAKYVQNKRTNDRLLELINEQTLMNSKLNGHK